MRPVRPIKDGAKQKRLREIDAAYAEFQEKMKEIKKKLNKARKEIAAKKDAKAEEELRKQIKEL